MEISFATDSNGFLLQECPSCNQYFKALMGHGSSEPVSFCPYCGYEGRQCWFTPEQLEYIRSVATSRIVAPLLKDFGSSLKRSSNSFIKIDVKSNSPDPVVAPVDIDEEMEIKRFPCCDETVKLNRVESTFCIICGAQYSMVESEAKKVFLSHKGVDKEKVKDFHRSLELLGYHPWLDEDAMPAGTTLERGLLRGMQDSCGVVFFVTPAFKDEGYLETEVNYAIAEKRKKGDKFAIITLQFSNELGDRGGIPELLRTYVWKSPASDLEALREIVRALPIESKLVDWREEIPGVVTSSLLRPKSAELSDEAKAILVEAAAGDGHILHVRYMGGEEIQTNGKSLIPSTDARTTALWVGGLEDLRRRRYILDRGHKGEVFEVTREGYEAVDALKPR